MAAHLNCYNTSFHSMNSISSLAFPFDQVENADVYLNKLILSEASEKTRYIFQLDGIGDKRQCTSIEKIDSLTQLKTGEAISYIDNVSTQSVSPLLVRCDPYYNRVKFHLSIKLDTSQADQKLVIVKTKGDNDDKSKIAEILETNVKSNSEMEISTIRYDSLPLEGDTCETQKIIVRDSFSPERFNGATMNVMLFQFKGSEIKHMFDFKLFIDKFVKKAVSKIDTKIPSVLFSDYRNSFSFVLEDGPEFRKILARYEDTIPKIQKNTSMLIEEVKTMEQNLKRLIHNKKRIQSIIASFGDMNPILPKYDFKQAFRDQLDLIFDPIENQVLFFVNNVCEKKLLDKIKAVSNMEDEKNELANLKKNFEHDSKEYYNWLKKYLSNEKDRTQLKLLSKRKKFELSKFEYLSFLNSFTNNQYLNAFLENLFKFLYIDFTKQLPKDFNKVGMSSYYKIYLSVLLKFNSEKYKLHQMIESSLSNDDLTNIIRFNNLAIDSASNDDLTIKEDNLDLIFSPVDSPIAEKASKSPEIAAPEDPSEKSGMLYALGGKGKQGWHKEWVVVKDGELKEYSDWRTANSPINNPIQIALSNVKPTTHDKRQNCFEIFTSKGQKAIFQALNEQERDNWIKALDSSRQIVNTDRINEGLQQKDKPNSRLATKLHLKMDKPKLPIKNNESHSPISIKSTSIIPKDYLKTVRGISGSNNHICADCGSTESVEWISANLLVVLCIQCSSYHRNLGSHLSKVRSLKYDNFDKESEFLLNFINNKVHNSYLEAKLDFDKSLLTGHEMKQQFIKDKYVERKYCEEVEDIKGQLFKSIRAIDIEETIRYILLGAEVNLQVQLSDKISKVLLFEYSLRKYLIIESDQHVEKLFIIAEILLLNGCKVNPVNYEMELSQEAIEFWESKYSKIA